MRIKGNSPSFGYTKDRKIYIKPTSFLSGSPEYLRRILWGKKETFRNQYEENSILFVVLGFYKE